MTPSEIREHNEICADDEIIWCECDRRKQILLSCANCGGAVAGVVIYKAPNDGGKRDE